MPVTNFLSTDLFSTSVTSLADSFRGVVTLAPTPVSKFKDRYASFLEKANQGEVQVIAQGTKRYVLLSEEQVIALAERGRKQRSLGDVARGVESPRTAISGSSLYSKPSAVAQFKLPRTRGGE